jgi:hypothetical protein
MATSTATATYSEFSRYCGQFGIPPVDQSLYNKLIQFFPFFDVFLFACDVFAGKVDGFTIQLLRAMDDCGSVSYGLARTYCSHYGLEDCFVEAYGIAGDWENPEDGSPIGIDAGELIAWVNSRA